MLHLHISLVFAQSGIYGHFLGVIRYIVQIFMAIIAGFTGNWHKHGQWDLVRIWCRRIEHTMIKNPVGARFSRHLRIKIRYVITDAVWVLLLVYAGTGRIEYRESASSVRSNCG